MSLVSFVGAQSPAVDSVKQAIFRALKLVDFGFDKSVNKVLIKPNLCYYYHPSTGEVTDPQFVGALIDVLRENFPNNVEIFVAESDASAMNCDQVFKMLEYDKLAGEKGVELVNLAKQKFRVVNTNLSGSSFSFHVPTLFDEVDLVVNVPKPKYMESVRLSCALKNFYGCNSFVKKSVYHKKLDEAIVFINKHIKTHLVVVDGMVVNGRSTKRLNMVMASNDVVASDAGVASLMGISPRSVRQIILASKEGLGNSDFLPKGDFSYFKKNFPKKNKKDKIREKLASTYLRLMSS